MLFNTAVFLQFFAAFLLLYWLVRKGLRARNVLIVVASYTFYGWWSPDTTPETPANESITPLWAAIWQCRFLALLVATSLLDFCVGLGLEQLKSQRQRRVLLLISVVANLSVLGFFKYSNFFIESLASLSGQLGLPMHVPTFTVVLPVGISFYTFQSMSYTIDVYRRDLTATRPLTHFLAYVSFFPQLVAGPIERGTHLLPQFDSTRVITRAHLEEGVWLMLWGMFKKVALADNFAPLVDMVSGE